MQTAKPTILATGQIVKGSNAATIAAVDAQTTLAARPSTEMLLLLRSLQYQIDQIAATLP